MRQRARTDANQADIVKHLRGCGVTVFPTHQLGRGFPDIVCGFGGMTYLFEIKDPAKPPSKRRLTDDEREFHANWRGQIAVIETADDALVLMGMSPHIIN